MSQPLKVAIAGATGETGQSIANALLKEPEVFDVIALVRPSSLAKKAVAELSGRGVKVVATDLTQPAKDVSSLLVGIDVVICCFLPFSMEGQLNLITACKDAGVKRFVPSFWGPVIPPRGVTKMRDDKENVLDYIKRIYLPYTVIDVGWWYQISLPPLSFLKDPFQTLMTSDISGDGNVPIAVTDLADIGPYVARIIADPQTLNKSVLAYGELWTQNSIWDLLQQVSGESVPKKYNPAEEILSLIKTAKEAIAKDPTDFVALARLANLEYRYTWGVRGDNTPEHASYLGYLNAKELYPDVKVKKFEEFANEIVQGKAKKIYEGRQDIQSLRDAASGKKFS